MDDLKRPSGRRVAKRFSRSEAITLATTTVTARPGIALLQAQSFTATARREIVQREAVQQATVLVDASKANLANIMNYLNNSLIR